MESDAVVVDAAIEPRRPRPHIGIKDVLCVGPIILNSIYYYAGIPLTPLLLGRNPLLLSALRGTHRVDGHGRRLRAGGSGAIAARADRSDTDLDDDRPVFLLGWQAIRPRS